MTSFAAPPVNPPTRTFGGSVDMEVLNDRLWPVFVRGALRGARVSCVSRLVGTVLYAALSRTSAARASVTVHADRRCDRRALCLSSKTD